MPTILPHTAEGEIVHVLEQDDGSGWVKVADESGGKGLVPASYVEIVSPAGQRSPTAEIRKTEIRKKSSVTYGLCHFSSASLLLLLSNFTSSTESV